MATPEPAHTAPARLGRAVYLAWCGAAVALLLLLVGTRWLRYTRWSSAPGLDGALAELMAIQNQVFLWGWGYSRLYVSVVPVALLVLAVGFHRRLPAQVVRRVDGRWGFTPITTALLLGTLVWCHYMLDTNPTVAAVCATSLALAWALERPRVAAAFPPGAALGVLAVFAAGALFVAGDVVDRLAIGVWALFLLGTHVWAAGRVGAADLALVRILVVMPMNLLPGFLPLIVPMHGGAFLGEGLAYSFCEVPGRGTVYATIPVCDSIRVGYEDCRDGRVVEYDLQTMQLAATHHFFSPSFYGRLELLVCLEDEVQVAVQASVYQGKLLVQSAMSFSVARPEDFVPVVAGREIGTTIAYDAVHDALFYVGEFTNRVLRYDRRTRRLEDRGDAYFLRPFYQPVLLEPHTGSLMLHTTSIDPGRNLIYLADWMRGRYAYGLDLSTFALAARYDVGGGGSLGVSVDSERDRLFVSSVWGLEIVDLASGTITRKRLGLGNRPVVVDAARNRLYVSSMAEGKIRILDRDTLDVIGQIPIGTGSRYPHLSRDGKHLFASSTAGHYSFDPDALVPGR